MIPYFFSKFGAFVNEIVVIISVLTKRMEVEFMKTLNFSVQLFQRLIKTGTKGPVPVNCSNVI